MEKVCYIFGAGDLYEENITIPDNAFVIAADAGIYQTKALGIPVDLVLGDFDSGSIADAGENAIVFPPEKDYTDTFLAVQYGFDRGIRNFEIFACLGGNRLSHSIANIQMLSYFAKRGCKINLHGKNEIIFALYNSPDITGKEKETVSFDENYTGYISVFALDGDVKGLTVTGLKYQLEEKTLESDFPLGVSNEFCGEKSNISFSSGMLLIVCQKQQKK